MLQLILYSRFNLFAVKEFDEEIEGAINHRHHLPTTVALCVEPDYNIDAEQPEMFSDWEDEPLTRVWHPQKAGSSSSHPRVYQGVASPRHVVAAQHCS